MVAPVTHDDGILLRTIAQLDPDLRHDVVRSLAWTVRDSGWPERLVIGSPPWCQVVFDDDLREAVRQRNDEVASWSRP